MKALIVAFVAAGAFLVGSFYPEPDPSEKEDLIMYSVSSILEQVHFRPLEINDDFSEKAFNYYLDMLDNSKRFLTQEEVDQLAIYKDQIDDQYKERNLDFFNLSETLINSAIERAEVIYKEEIQKDFEFESNEMINVDREEVPFAQNEEELRDSWRKMLKYEILMRLEEKLEDQEDAEEKKDEETLKKESIEDAKEMFDDWFKRLGEIRRSDRFEAYLNTITHLHDPHTDYYNPKEKEDFNIAMGGRFEGIGARLSKDGDYTVVTDIIVGGPAWKAGELEVDDHILAVKQEDEEEALDVVGMRNDDVVTHIRGKKGTKVTLTVKKKDGTSRDITIERDVVIIEEGNAKSAILEQADSGNKVGYIWLPKFYADFETKDGRSCAVHVAQEVEKLKAENVDGIVLDLRNNGGGSLRDVVQMSGLFIDKGPIVQVKPRGRKAYVLDDEDSEVQYNGHLIVMVNGYSASASEILAAALQDYDRAVIVGSKSTFGKGTVQRFYDLDRAIRGNDNLKPLGEVKLTTQKFYRIDGGSTQLKGVVPDIILPDNFHYIDVGEKQYDYAMEWTEIDPVNYNKQDYVMPDLEMLKNNSSKRVEKSEAFELVLENAERLKRNREDREYSLNFDEFNAEVDRRESEADRFRNLWKEPIEGLSASNLAVDMEFIQADSSRIARNDVWIEDLTKDIYIKEVLEIMDDMIEQSPKITSVEKKQ